MTELVAADCHSPLRGLAMTGVWIVIARSPYIPLLSLRGARILGDEAISGAQGVLETQKKRLPRLLRRLAMTTHGAADCFGPLRGLAMTGGKVGLAMTGSEEGLVMTGVGKGRTMRRRGKNGL